METETVYGLRKAEERNLLPETDLLIVPYKGKNLAGSFFGPNNYKDNQAEMSKQYWHSNSQPDISFRPATTSESISAAAYDFENEAKPKIFDPRWLQAGYIVRTSDGVWANTKITDEKSLKQLLNGIKKVNGIYLLDNGMGFAPYETFERRVQDCETFAQGGLARVLEHTQEKVAENLRTISSPRFYKNGINVFGFDKIKEPVLRVAGLSSGRDYDRDRLDVVGNDWYGDYNGYAFGVCAPEKSK
ncbi:MAG: hypothetical protein AABX48_03335 [Nanoarchaeota archaeon]